MDAIELKACARVLLTVAFVDGKIDPEERRLLELFECDPHAPTEPIDLEAELAKLTSETAQARTLHAALALADIDGHCTSRELAVLKRIHARCGAKSELSLSELHAEKRAEIEEVREKLEEASIAFLHEVGKRGDGLTQKEYEALATALSEKKREILRGAVAVEV